MQWIQWILIGLTGVYIIYKDLKERIIPNEINLFIFICGIGVMIYTGQYISHVTGCLVLGMGMLFVAVITKAFGLGDVKYIFASGMLLGFRLAGYGLIIGIIFGGIFSAALLVTKKVTMKDHIAYGPYLVMGNVVALLML